MVLKFDKKTGWPLGAGLVAFAAAILFQAFCILRPVEFLIDVLYERDDSYYYLVIARNLAERGVATFDGTHLSNGVQLLWGLLLVGLAKLVADPIAYLRATLWLCLFFSVLAGLMLRRIGERLVSPVFGDVALFLFAGLLFERWDTLEGMEYSLHLAIIMAVILTGIAALRAPSYPRLALCSLFLCLNFWTRLDSALFSVAIWIAVSQHLARRFGRSRGLKSAAVMAILPTAGAIGFMALSYRWGATLLPLSGGVKAFYADQYFDGVAPARAALDMAKMWLKINIQAFLVLVPENLADFGAARLPVPTSNVKDLLYTLAPVAATLIGLSLILFHRDLRSRYGRLILPLAFLYQIATIHVAVNVLFLKDFSHVSRHYYGWLMVFWLFWGGLVLMCLMEILHEAFGRLLAGLFCTASLGAYALIITRLLTAPVAEDNYMVIRYRLAGTLNKSLPEDAVVAAWNAGILGYFLDRPVINLDGLVNDADFLAFLKSGAPIQTYLKAQKVGYLIDHNERDLTLKYGEERDLTDEYRNGIRWSEVTVLQKVGAIYVLRFNPAAGG